MSVLSFSDLRQTVTDTWDELVPWFKGKPRLFRLPRPEQQLSFEFACRLRELIRKRSDLARWDRLFFDGACCDPSEMSQLSGVGYGLPIYVDAHQLYGVSQRDRRDHSQPDIAIAVHVLRAAHELLDLDEDGCPRHQDYLPRSMHIQGCQLEEQVRALEHKSGQDVAGYIFVVYSNQAQRKTAVERRDVASWAAWTEEDPTLWWTSRFFRQRGSSRP
jgi:hypothetical protein